MFLAKGGKKISEPQLDGNEELEVELFSIDEVKQLVKENKIVQAMHVACIMYALEKIGKLVI